MNTTIPTEDLSVAPHAIFPGGNDYPAEQAEVGSICVGNPEETKRVIERIIACLGHVQTTTTARGT